MREACSSVPSQFIFAEMHLCLEITVGAQESEAAELVKTLRYHLGAIIRLLLEYGTNLSKSVNNAFLLVESLWLPTKEKPAVY